MNKHYKYASVSEALSILKDKGYITDFNIHEEKIIKNPSSFLIDYVFRYEGETNPDDEAIVFGISSKQEKGVFVTGFSANSISEAAKILLDVSIKQ